MLKLVAVDDIVLGIARVVPVPDSIMVNLVTTSLLPACQEPSDPFVPVVALEVAAMVT